MVWKVMSKEFPLTSDTGKRYRNDVFEGNEVRVYESGVVYNTETNQIVSSVISSDRASDMVQRREELKLETIETAIMDHGAGSVSVGLTKLAKVQVTIAGDPANGYNATRAWEKLLQHGGYSQGMQGSLQSSPNTIINVLIAALKPHMQGSDDDDTVDVVIDR